MQLTRRGALAGGLWLAATPALAEAALDAAPPATDIAAWTRYEARLRDRLRDGGGLKFDDACARGALEATNAHRRAAGAAPLVWHDELAAAARAHAADQAARDFVEHLSPEGFDPSHRFWLLGRTTIGSPSENIAYHRAEGPPAGAAGDWPTVGRASCRSPPSAGWTPPPSTWSAARSSCRRRGRPRRPGGACRKAGLPDLAEGR